MAGLPTRIALLVVVSIAFAFAATGAAASPQVEIVDAGLERNCVVLDGTVRCRGFSIADPDNWVYARVADLTGTPTALSVGASHACAVLSGGVKCWGNGSWGQLGHTSYTSSSSAVQVGGLISGATDVTAGKEFSCAIVSGAAKCWGRGSNGQLGVNLGDSSITQNVTGLSSDVTHIDAGESSACAVVAGAAKCWGYGISGRLGNGTHSNSFTPVQVAGLTSGVTRVAVGDRVACAIVNGGVQCWGGVAFSGAAEFPDSFTPVPVTGWTSGVTQLAVSTKHICAVVSGETSCMGAAELNGNGLLANSAVPSPVKLAPANATALSVSSTHSCVIADQELHCWGDSWRFAADGSAYKITPAAAVWGAEEFVLSNTRYCYRTAAEVRCGGGEAGEVQFPNSGTDPEPDTVDDIAIGGGHACVTADGTAWCWGANNVGQIGIGVETSDKRDGSFHPAEVPGLEEGVSRVTAGSDFSCAIVYGSVACFGWDHYGQLGDGASTDGLDGYAVAVDNLEKDTTDIDAGANFTCAVKDGGAYCWGRNNRGQLGNGTTTDSNSPVAVTGLQTGVTDVVARHSTACAIQNQELKCWGANDFGLLGSGGSGQSTSPVPVAGLADVTDVSVGSEHACAVNDGSLKCWGRNDRGQLGTGTVTNADAPVDVFGMESGVTEVEAGISRTCAVANGVGYCWGSTTGRVRIGSLDLKTFAVPVHFEPETTFVLKPDEDSTSTTANFELSSSVPGSTFQCARDRLDNEDSSFDEVTASFSLTDLPQGGHDIVCRAVSPEGIPDPKPVGLNWTVDTLPPILATGVSRIGNKLHVVISTTDNSTVNSTCKVNDSAPVYCQNSWTTPELGFGTHTIVVTATDSFGNVSSDVLTYVFSPPATPEGPPATPAPAPNVKLPRSMTKRSFAKSGVKLNVSGALAGSTVTAELQVRSGKRWIKRASLKSTTNGTSTLTLKPRGRAMTSIARSKGKLSARVVVTAVAVDGRSSSVTRGFTIKK